MRKIVWVLFAIGVLAAAVVVDNVVTTTPPEANAPEANALDVEIWNNVLAPCYAPDDPLVVVDGESIGLNRDFFSVLNADLPYTVMELLIPVVQNLDAARRRDFYALALKTCQDNAGDTVLDLSGVMGMVAVDLARTDYDPEAIDDALFSGEIERRVLVPCLEGVFDTWSAGMASLNGEGNAVRSALKVAMVTDLREVNADAFRDMKANLIPAVRSMRTVEERNAVYYGALGICIVSMHLPPPVPS